MKVKVSECDCRSLARRKRLDDLLTPSLLLQTSKKGYLFDCTHQHPARPQGEFLPSELLACLQHQNSRALLFPSCRAMVNCSYDMLDWPFHWLTERSQVKVDHKADPGQVSINNPTALVYRAGYLFSCSSKIYKQSFRWD